MALLCSVDEILRFLDEKFGIAANSGASSAAPLIRAAPFVGQARTSYTVQNQQGAVREAASTPAPPAKRAGGRVGSFGGFRGAAAKSSRADAEFPEPDEAEEIDADRDGGDDDAEDLLKEVIAARAIERLIAAGHEDDGAAQGLAEVVAREAASALSSESEPAEASARADTLQFGALLDSVNNGGRNKLPAGSVAPFPPSAAAAAARSLALQIAGSSAACAKSMMGYSVAVRGQNQKAQMAAVDRFRRGEVNVLVATCIAEEGLVSGAS